MYSAILLDEKSRSKLTTWATDNVKVNHIRLPILVRDAGWKMVCHHMTIQFPGIPEYAKQYLNTDQTLEVTHLGISDKAVAVRVNGFPSSNKIPHITIAVNELGGGKPVDSNKITNWSPVEKPFTLKGKVVQL